MIAPFRFSGEPADPPIRCSLAVFVPRPHFFLPPAARNAVYLRNRHADENPISAYRPHVPVKGVNRTVTVIEDKKAGIMRSFRTPLPLLIMGMLILSCSASKQPLTITQYTDPNYVTGIAASGDTAWCATRGGLVRWNLRTHAYAVFTTGNGLPSNVLSDIVIDGSGTIWIASDAGIAMLKSGSWKRFDTSNGLPSNTVNALAVDSGGNVWASTEAGVVSFKGNRPGLIDDPAGPGKIPVNEVFFDSGKNIWVATADKGIFVNLQGTWKNLTTRNGLVSNQIRSITEDIDNSIWSATSAGVAIGDGNGFVSLNVRQYYSDRKSVV
jgi:hypothetical protein